MTLKRNIKVFGAEQKTITRSELSLLTFCNSKKLPLAVNDGNVRKEWVGIGWIEDGKPHGDEPFVVDDEAKLRGRFAIVLPGRNQAIFLSKRRLWETREETESYLTSIRKRTLVSRDLESAYIGELGKDFWLDE